MTVKQLMVCENNCAEFCRQRSLPPPRSQDRLFGFGEISHSARALLQTLIVEHGIPLERHVTSKVCTPGGVSVQSSLIDIDPSKTDRIGDQPLEQRATVDRQKAKTTSIKQTPVFKDGPHTTGPRVMTQCAYDLMGGWVQWQQQANMPWAWQEQHLYDWQHHQWLQWCRDGGSYTIQDSHIGYNEMYNKDPNMYLSAMEPEASQYQPSSSSLACPHSSWQAASCPTQISGGSCQLESTTPNTRACAGNDMLLNDEDRELAEQIGHAITQLMSEGNEWDMTVEDL